jgi:hypothetical protein
MTMRLRASLFFVPALLAAASVAHAQSTIGRPTSGYGDSVINTAIINRSLTVAGSNTISSALIGNGAVALSSIAAALCLVSFAASAAPAPAPLIGTPESLGVPAPSSVPPPVPDMAAEGAAAQKLRMQQQTQAADDQRHLQDIIRQSASDTSGDLVTQITAWRARAVLAEDKLGSLQKQVDACQPAAK